MKFTDKKIHSGMTYASIIKFKETLKKYMKEKEILMKNLSQR